MQVSLQKQPVTTWSELNLIGQWISMPVMCFVLCECGERSDLWPSYPNNLLNPFLALQRLSDLCLLGVGVVVLVFLIVVLEIILVILYNNSRVREFVLKAEQLYWSIRLLDFPLKKYMLFVAWIWNSLYFACRKLAYVTCHLWFPFMDAWLQIMAGYNFCDEMKVKVILYEWLSCHR